MDITSTLKKLGLTDKQAKVYLSMLELGESPMTDIARKANLKRPTVYLVIDELSMLGLSSEIIKGKKKFYTAVHPKRLIELASFRHKQAENILPELLALQKSDDKPKVRMLEGIAGARIAYQEAFSLLNNKEEGLWLGNITFMVEHFPELLHEYNILIKKIRDPHIRELIYGGDVSRKWAEDMQDKIPKNHFIKYMGDDKNFGKTDQFIIGNKIIMFSFGNEMFVTIIESYEMAQSTKALFEIAWS
jgi:HTH-type transcriptional regulator, sugar sensing transcriptional regulator